MTARRRASCRLAAVALALTLGAAAGCMKPNDNAPIQNYLDHPIELWSVFDDDRPEFYRGSIRPGQFDGLSLMDCLSEGHRVEIRHPDGQVIDERTDLCPGDRWEVGTPPAD